MDAGRGQGARWRGAAAGAAAAAHGRSGCRAWPGRRGRGAPAAAPAAGATAPAAPAGPPPGPTRQQIGTLEDGESLKQYVKVNDWNTFHVIARGNTLIHILNGHVTAIFIDDDETNRAMKGVIGIQIHTGPPMKLEVRNVGLKMLR